MTETRFFALQGGLDLISPAIVTPVGRVIAALNYEPHPRGYQRVEGYERFDGRPKPSKASYWRLRFDAGAAAITEGESVTGASSAATGVALIDAVVESGTYAGGDAAGYLVLTGVSGTFSDNENLEVGAVTHSVADGEAVERGALNDDDDSTWHQSAIEAARDAIQAVPGSGPVRGVWLYEGERYAFRDNGAGTAGVMHKATSSGWVAQALGSEIAFDAGSAEFAEGETVTGGTSGASATVKRVVLESGDWSTDDAVGRVILAGLTGTFQDNETITSASGSATANGASAAITLPAGGRYQFVNHNFFGAADLKRMYAVQGEGRGFEWDGAVFVPINTGMDDDRPIRIGVHRNHLFFAFRGGSLQHSSIGKPYQWQVLTGAGEIGLGEEVTDLLGSVSGALAAFGQDQVAVLLGQDAENWDLRTLASDAGAESWTAQSIGTPIYLDNRGLRSLETTERFGDFLIGTITQMVEPIFRAKRKAGVTAVGSLRVRAKDQYRLFFSDGTGLTVYFGRSPAEILPFDLGMTITCSASGKASAGDEVLLVGDGEGWVYELDAGTSFDGAPVTAFLRLPFNHVGTPAQKKRWQRAVLEVDASAKNTLGVTAEFGYADPNQPPAIEQSFDIRGSGGFWNEDLWDQFYWSSPVEGLAEVDIDGLGRNLSLAVVSEAIYEEVHVIHGVTLYFSYRGLAR